MTFVIDADNNITAYADAAAPDGGDLKLSEHRFSSKKELATLAASWPGGRLIEIWKSLHGASPVKRFTDRKKAVARIWKAVQRLIPTEEANPVKAPATKKASRTMKATGAPTAAKGAKEKPVGTSKANKGRQSRHTA